MHDDLRLRDHAARCFNASLLLEHFESEVCEAIAALPVEEVTQERAQLITRLAPEIAIRAPRIAWAEARYDCQECDQSEFRCCMPPVGMTDWQCSLVVPFEDQNCVLWSIPWPLLDEGRARGFKHELEDDFLTVVQTVSAKTRGAAAKTFATYVEAFQSNVVRAMHEIERYNAALPYLISITTEKRLDGKEPDHESLKKLMKEARAMIERVHELLLAESALALPGEEQADTGDLFEGDDLKGARSLN